MTQHTFDPQCIEEKWQRKWKEQQPYKAEIDNALPKYYVLDMFPYPSGAGLHVGHVTGYTASDIVSRFKRKQGFNVLHPMGWDSFGLPAEQYAVKTGTHPRITTKKNIDTYRRQLKSLGYSYDWSREIATSHPKFYKWTQWIFQKLYDKGLAYEAEMLVNFCPQLGTVLSNEEVENGKSIVGGFPVERKPFKQWVLKITEYADRLLKDLEEVSWPENIKQMQINWIGRSEGCQVTFAIQGQKESFEVFTTRADTLFGVTFAVLSPEHPLVDKITSKEQMEVVTAYRKEVATKSDLERTGLAKDKTGVWTGAYTINPVTGDKIPVWIADYVLMGYGTGAVMGVPGHDERDFEFANKFNLKIRSVIAPENDPEFIPDETFYGGEGTYINSHSDELSLEGKDLKGAKEAVALWLEKKSLGRSSVTYKLRDWLFSRQRYWGEPVPILHFEDGSTRLLEEDELPLCPPDLEDFRPSEGGESPLAKVKEWVEITDPKTGKKARRETNTMPQWAGSCWYYLRYCDPRNDDEAIAKEKDQYWMPVDLYLGGTEHAVTHLLYARFWHKVLYDIGVTHTKEPFKRYYGIGMVTSKSYKRSSGQYIEPKDVDHREDGDYLKGTDEKLSSQLEKMSKSKLNGSSPDDAIADCGADALRMYEVFMGPLDQEKVWNDEAVQGCYRFLSRVYNLCHGNTLTDEDSEEGFKLAHKMLQGVMHDLDSLLFNTAIAKMMEFLNAFSKLDKHPKSCVKILLQALNPFAPHLTCEMWEVLGETSDLTRETLPQVEEKYLVEEQITYVLQVNGKVRGRLDMAPGATKDDLMEIALKQEGVSRHIDGKEIRKSIFVPNKLLNLVV